VTKAVPVRIVSAYTRAGTSRLRRRSSDDHSSFHAPLVTDTAPLMILIAGPYRSGANGDPAKMAENVRVMEEYALPLFRAGHTPIVGEWIALPLIGLAGSTQVGDAAFDEIFDPIAERLVLHCDAVLRVGGVSKGADDMVDAARARGLPVFHTLRDVPGWAAVLADARPPGAA
jgi:hypothetical protein